MIRLLFDQFDVPGAGNFPENGGRTLERRVIIWLMKLSQQVING